MQSIRSARALVWVASLALHPYFLPQQLHVLCVRFGSAAFGYVYLFHYQQALLYDKNLFQHRYDHFVSFVTHGWGRCVHVLIHFHPLYLRFFMYDRQIQIYLIPVHLLGNAHITRVSHLFVNVQLLFNDRDGFAISNVNIQFFALVTAVLILYIPLFQRTAGMAFA